MNHQQRMTRTLACLVASMTIGALCLQMMKPHNPAPPTAMDRLMAVDKAWESIQVDAEPLDKTINPEQSHFLVYGNGDWEQTASWDARRPVGPRPVVRISLLAPAGSRKITHAQDATTRKLVHQLQKACRIADERIKWDSTLNLPRAPAAS
ncbi:MAG: hypothetical protein KA354_15620 [Phycisphaerae bacterium]|nr:hypothetical protein [Phycisphaerae bacterium]